MPGSMGRLAGKVGEVMLAGIDRAVEQRWDVARARAADLDGSVEGRVEQAIGSVAGEMAAVGAAAGGVAAVPGIGTATSLGSAATELAWFTTRASDLILTIGAIHGHTEAEPEQRRAWILSVLAYGDSAAAGFAAVATKLGSRARGGLPVSVLRSANRVVARALIRRYGSRRGVVALGRALPFGIGAAIGGKANHSFTRMIGRQADDFFRELPPPLADDREPAA